MRRAMIVVFAVAIASLVPLAMLLSEDQGEARQIDLLVRGDWVLTMQEGEEPLRNGAIAIHDGKIVEVLPSDIADEKYIATSVLSGDGKIVMPGLINGHTHAAMTLLRGIGNDRDLNDWLTNVIFPLENQFVDEDFVRVGTQLACWEMLRGGTTTFVDMYFFPDAVANTVVDCGARVVVVPSIIDQPAPDAASGPESLAQAIDFVERWKGTHPRVTPALGGHAIYTLSEETLLAIREAAIAHEVPIGIHLSETLAEQSFSENTYGMTPTQKLAQLGVFDVHVIAAHCVHAAGEDFGILADGDVGVIHNPTSNMKLASGIAPVPSFQEWNVRLGLGTDGAASNNDLNMWEEMRLAAFLQKVATGDPSILAAEEVLALATREGAIAIGKGEELGALAPGYRADVIQVSADSTAHLPVYNPFAHLVYAVDEDDVESVVVEGQVVVENGQLLTIDEERLRRNVQSVSNRVAAAALAASEDR